MKIYKSLSIALLLAGTVPASTMAQSYYDDDIYYDASKDVKKKAESPKSQTKSDNALQNTGASAQYRYLTATDGSVYVVDEQGNAYPVTAQNIPGSDLYTVYTDNTRDVDEYNRRYQYADTVAADSLYRDSFANTRNIERFSNPTIVSESNDLELIEYYAATQPAQINIYMDTPAYYGWNFVSPYYRPYGYWGGWGWDPWYGPGWYDPYYSWSWGWAPSWGWGPSWSWTWGPGWYPGHAHVHPQRPISPGAHRPAYPGSNIAHSTNGSYRGNTGSRPGGTTQGSYRGNTGSRPSTVGNVNSLGTTRPATNYNNGSRPGTTRNTGVNTGGSRTGGRSNSVNNNSNRSTTTTPSYRSSGSSSGGSRGSFGGGSRSSGGGSGRGGRR